MGPQIDWNNTYWWLRSPTASNFATFDPYTTVTSSEFSAENAFISSELWEELISTFKEQEKDLDPGNTEAIDEFLNEFINGKEKGFDT